MFGLKFSKIINDINYVLLPPVCFGCNAQLIRGEQLLCTVCRYDLPLTEFNFTQDNAVDRIFIGKVPIAKAVSFLYFYKNGIVKGLLHHLKYGNQMQLGGFLGKWYAEILIEQGNFPKLDVVIPVPLHPRKLRKRGYNQVDAFGKQLATYTKTPYVTDVLIKKTNTNTQTKKNRIDRLLGSEDIFEITDPHLLEDKRILLVDDVITTGATIVACTKALLEARNIEVYVATMAFVP